MTALETLREYLASQDWQNLNVIAVGEELYVTITAEHFHALPVAARALAGSLTAHGDYEIIDRTAMRTADGETVSVTYQVEPN